MADTETTTSPKSIEELCRAWKVADARLKLEALEAGPDDKVAAACERNTQRVSKIYEQIENADTSSQKDVYALLSLAQHVLGEGEYSGGDPSDRAFSMIGKALLGLHYVEIKTKDEQENTQSAGDAARLAAFCDLEGSVHDMANMAEVAVHIFEDSGKDEHPVFKEYVRFDDQEREKVAFAVYHTSNLVREFKERFLAAEFPKEGAKL